MTEPPQEEVHRDDFDAALVPGFRGKTANQYAELPRSEERRAEYAQDLGIVLEERPCPVCATPASGAEVLLSKEGFDVVRCPGCGFVFNDRIVPETQLETFLEQNVSAHACFDLHGNESYQGLKQRKCRYILQETGKWTGGRSLLDIGCFAGDMLVVGDQLGWRCVGVESNAEAVRRGREKGLDIVRGLLPRDAAKIDRSFAVVTALDVLEHVPDPLAFLDGVAPLIEPDGVLAVQVPNLESLYVQLCGPDNHNFCLDHVSSFSRETLEAVTRRAGFETLRIETFITELDLVAAFDRAHVERAVSRLRGRGMPVPDPLTTGWLHEQFLGYKLFWIGRRSLGKRDGALCSREGTDG